MRSNTKPLLSICIPTHNRADVLEICINSIVGNPCFSEDIEVVVSDNASSDTTMQLMAKYTKKYENIKYHRNNENIGVVKNFIRVIDLASGIFRKPLNDYSVFSPKGLGFLLEIVKNNLDQKPAILFHNTDKDLIEPYENLSLDQMILKEGWALSWMGENGFWEKEWSNLDNKEAYLDIMFVPIDYLFRIIDEKKFVNVYDAHFTDRYPFKEKQGGYNFFKVHTEYFLLIFKKYCKAGKISQSTYDNLNRHLFGCLRGFLTKFLITEKKGYAYEMNNCFWYLFRAFGRYPWFYWKMFKWFGRYICESIKGFV